MEILAGTTTYFLVGYFVFRIFCKIPPVSNVSVEWRIDDSNVRTVLWCCIFAWPCVVTTVLADYSLEFFRYVERSAINAGVGTKPKSQKRIDPAIEKEIEDFLGNSDISHNEVDDGFD